ncbi:MAG: DNA mismatch repair protein MutT [Dehalococcoidia bacterium]
MALALFHPARSCRVLVVQRPPWDTDLPGIWGLPAASLFPWESVEEAAQRCARTKLGAKVYIQGLLGEAWEEGASIPHMMTLFGALPEEDNFTLPPAVPGSPVTLYRAWQWASYSVLEEGARSGSLCCRLFLAWSAGATSSQSAGSSL